MKYKVIHQGTNKVLCSEELEDYQILYTNVNGTKDEAKIYVKRKQA